MEKLLTVEQAAELLSVKKSYIYEKTRTGQMPSLKVGKYLRIRLSELDHWLADENKNRNSNEK